MKTKYAFRSAQINCASPFKELNSNVKPAENGATHSKRSKTSKKSRINKNDLLHSKIPLMTGRKPPSTIPRPPEARPPLPRKPTWLCKPVGEVLHLANQEISVPVDDVCFCR